MSPAPVGFGSGEGTADPWGIDSMGSLVVTLVCGREGDPGQLDGRGDAELHEDLAQVVLHGLGADEDLRRDLAVARAAGDERRDPQLLRGQIVDRRGVALAGALPRGVELATGALGPRRRAEPLEELVRRAQL